MSWNLRPGGDGEFTDYLKYNAKSGRWFAKLEGADQDVEIQNPRLAWDFANIRFGWIAFVDGQGPEKVWHPESGPAPKPAHSSRFKEGLEVMVFGADKMSNGQSLGLREILQTSAVFKNPLQLMYEYWEKEAPTVDSLPVYKCTGVKSITSKHGDNYEPQFVFDCWVERAKIPAFGQVTTAPAVKPEPPNPGENTSQVPVEQYEDDIPF